MMVCSWHVGSPRATPPGVIWRTPAILDRSVFLLVRGEEAAADPERPRFALLFGCVVPLALILASILLTLRGRRGARLRDPALMLAVRERDRPKSPNRSSGK